MEKVTIGSTVTVNYTGKFEDGVVFDSSLMEGREPLTAKLGEGQLIMGFENGLMDMTIGESKTINVPASQAYGDVNPGMFFEIERTQLPEGVEVGMMLQNMDQNGPSVVRVVEIKEETVVLDANHPLAGKDLIFDIEVLEVQ
jgi:FKBP-type peptidyl-prolyl cis-trans isomerase 2